MEVKVQPAYSIDRARGEMHCGRSQNEHFIRAGGRNPNKRGITKHCTVCQVCFEEALVIIASATLVAMLLITAASCFF